MILSYPHEKFEADNPFPIIAPANYNIFQAEIYRTAVIKFTEQQGQRITSTPRKECFTMIKITLCLQSRDLCSRSSKRKFVRQNSPKMKETEFRSLMGQEKIYNVRWWGVNEIKSIKRLKLKVGLSFLEIVTRRSSYGL